MKATHSWLRIEAQRMAFVFSQNKHFSEVSLALQRQEPSMRSRLDIKLLHVMRYEEFVEASLGAWGTKESRDPRMIKKRDEGKITLEQWFSTRYALTLRGHSAVAGDSFSCHNWRERYNWHLAGRSQGRCQTSYSAQAGSTTRTYPTQNVNRANFKKLAVEENKKNLLTTWKVRDQTERQEGRNSLGPRMDQEVVMTSIKF